MGTLEFLKRVGRIAEDLVSSRGATVPKADRLGLASWLRDQPAAAKDLWPGYVPTQMGKPIPLDVIRKRMGLADPKPKETWYHGDENKNLQLYNPSFFTRDPTGAAWYAMDRGGPDFGAVGHYRINANNPARTRDLLQVAAEDPALLRSMDQHAPYGDTDNLLDLVYSPDARRALQDRGFDSALTSDILERSEIPALVPLSTDQVTPFARSILVNDTGLDFLRAKSGTTPRSQPWVGNDYYQQLGKTRPWTKKAIGGLAALSR